MNLKEAYEKMKVNLCIDKCIRDLFSEHLKLGTIVRITSRKKEKYSTCSPNLPSEYYSKDNLVVEFGIENEKNEQFLIREEYIGLNFEAPCDEYFLKIYDSSKYVVADTSDLDDYMEIKAKQKSKGKKK